MPTSHYINQNYRPEQNLMEDLFIESIKFYGTDAFYICRNDQRTDLVYGEDPTKSFTNAYAIEVYNSDTTDYEGQREIFSKFGLDIKDDYTVLLARKTFKQRVKQDLNYGRPKEGDLIFIPHVSISGTLFEITWVEPDKDFFITNRKLPFFYEIKLEPFKYSDELILTGNDEVDSSMFDEAYTINFQMGIGSGNYKYSEYVYQGTSLQTAVASAIVSEWNKPTLELKVTNITGIFSANTPVIGDTSHANYNLVTYDTLERNIDRVFDNKNIRNEGTSYINFSEKNPFGEP